MSHPSKHWVILVDDDEDDRFLVKQAFQAQSPKTILQCLSSGEELFQLLEQSVDMPALLLLDLNMPIMNGFDVLRRLRAHSDYERIPVIMLTTSDVDTDRQHALELGANSFVTKPPTLQELARIVTLLKQNWLVS
ncbi:response regulator [Spirosoma knui]